MSANGTPTASMPATIPKASSASCTMPATRRLAPDTACPAASSSTAVVQGGAGEEDDQRGDHGAQPGPGEVLLGGQRARAPTP